MQTQKFKMCAKQIIALLLTLCTLVGVLPLNVIAAELAEIGTNADAIAEDQTAAVSDEDIQQASDAISDAIQSISEAIDPPESENIATGDVEVSEDMLRFRLNADGASYTVIGYLSSSDTMEIPATYNGEQGNFPVTRIEEFAFQNKTKLKYVSIPDSIEYIGTEAFSGCENLEFEIYGNARYLGNAGNPYLYLHSAVSTDIESVEIHENTKFIGSYAFLNCTKLTEIAVPATVVQVGFKAFRHTDALQKITLPFVGEMASGTQNAHLGYVFGAQTYGGNISYVPESLREVVILGGERLAKNSFYGVDMITSLTLPFVGATREGTAGTNISYIYGYDDYTGNAYLPSSLVNITVLGGEIGSGAFRGCTGIESVTLPEDLKAIKDNTFYGCSKLKSIVIPDSVESIGASAFYGCKNLTNATIGSGVTNIGESAFSGCSSLASMNIPTGVTSIGSAAFSGCSSLTSINIPDGVTSIASSTFYNCSSLTSLTIPNSVTSIGYSAFYICSDLTSINIPDGITKIDSYVFSGCSSLKSINIPDSVTSIGSYAFTACRSLTSIKIPDSVTSIGDYAFNECIGLISVTIPDGVKSIGTSVFQLCSGLTSVTVGKGVTSISSFAFHQCSSLTSVNISEGVKSIANAAFRDCSNLTSVNIPDSVTSIGAGAFLRCSNLTNIYIPDSVTSIGDSAFYNCISLTIYCEAASQPSGWSSAWNDSNCPVVWGRTGDGAQMANAASYESEKISVVSEIEDEITSYNNVELLSASVAGTENEGSTNSDVKLLSSSTSETASVGLAYTLSSDGKSYTVKIGTCTDTDIVIPSTYNGLPVTGIGDYAFYQKTFITSINIPDSVTSIGQVAFAGCSSLTSINIPDSITSISVGASGWNVFSGCSNLKYNEYDNAYYLGNETNPYVILVNVESTSITSCEINPNTKFLYHYVFSGCSSLTSINIPDSVVSIGYYAFQNCTGLLNMTLGSGVNIIGIGAFYGCTGLTSVVMGNGVTSIESYAFYGCTGLTNIKVSNAVKNLGTRVFYGCSKLVYNEYDNAYYLGNDKTPCVILIKAKSTSITSCDINTTTKCIYDEAFRVCSLTSITLPVGVTCIGKDAFYGCVSLKSVYITDLTAWCNINFYNNYSNPLCFAKNLYLNNELLTDLAIPDGSTIINQNAFYKCSSQTSINIPNSVTSISWYAFDECSNLTSINIPNSVISVGQSAFAHCTSATSLTIGSSVTSIGQYAFYGLTALTEIYYNAVECADMNSSRQAFYNAGTAGDGIKVVIGANVKKIPAYLFYCSSSSYIPKIVSVEFAEGSVCESIGNYAFYKSADLKTVTAIPKTLEIIDKQAFANCTSLEAISYEGEYNEWRFIQKATNWDENAGAYELTCAPSKGLLYEMSDDAAEFYVSEFDASILPEELQATTTKVAVPETFGNRPVVEILRQAFYNCSRLVEITLPETVTEIGDYAFANCTSLSGMVIHDGVTVMGKGLFSGCSSLASLTVPYVGNTPDAAENSYLGYMFGAFEYKVNAAYVPASLTSVTVTGDTDIAEGAFYDCGMLTAINLTGSPDYIGDYAFANCKKFAAFAIPDSVKAVGINILEGCSGITSIHIGASLEDIAYSDGDAENKSFHELWGINKANSSLREYTVSPDNPKYSADEFGILYIDMAIPYASATERKKVTVADAPANANLSNYTFPDHIVEIRPYAFAYNSSLVEADLEYIRSIGSHAFYEADGLINVYLGETWSVSSEYWDYIEIIDYNQYIGDCAFMGCTALQRINIDTEVLIGIGDQAFYDCEKLKTVILGKKIQVIGSEAFGASYSGKSNLEQFSVNAQNEHFMSIGGVLYSRNADGSLTLEWYPACLPELDITVNADGTKTQSVKIGENNKTSYVTKFSLPDKLDGEGGAAVTVSAIGAYAFRTAAKLEEVDLESAASLAVGDYAFAGSSIYSVNIGAGVTSLGLKRGEGEYTVFADCAYLTEINVDAQNSYYSSIDGVLFDKKQNTLIKYPANKGGETLSRYILPESVSVIASMAFKGNDALVSVSVPSYIASVGLEAFYDCSNLLVIFFDDVYAPVSVMENAFTTMSDAGTVIGYSESKYFDGAAANEYGWENYDDIYVTQAMSAIPEIDIANSNGAYAIVIVNENGERINGIVDADGKTNFIVTLTDPQGVSETIHAGKDVSGLGDGVAVFYDLYGMVQLGFSIDYEGAYSLRVSDTMGAYYTYVAEEFYLDSDMRITYVTLVHKPCNIIFNANGGSGSIADLSVTIGVDNTLPAGGFERPGYTFRGWSNTPDGAVEYPAGTFNVEKYKDHFVLYAVWEANTNTVKFDANGGSGSMADVYVKTDASVTLPVNTFAIPAEGYEFGGWSVQIDETTVEYIDDQAVFTSGPKSEYTLSAIWVAQDRELVFHANGGTGSMEKQVSPTDTTVTLNSNAFSRLGYTFKGWSTTPNGAVEKADGDSYTMTGVAVQILYAVWEADTHVLSFNANGGVGSMQQVSAKTDETIALPQGEFSRSGYIFVGWADSATSSLAYDNVGSYTMTPTDTTLYAVWTKGPTVYGVSCNEVDINTQTTTINKKEFGKIYDSVELIDPKKGYVEGNFSYIGERSEELTVSVIAYFDSSYLSLVDSGCMLYQNGKAIAGCTFDSERTAQYEDSAVLYFTVPVESLVPEVPVEVRIGVTDGFDVFKTSSFLAVDVIDDTVDEDEIKIDAHDLNVDLGQAGKIIVDLLGSPTASFQLGSDNLNITTEVDGDKTTVSLNGELSKDFGKDTKYDSDCEKGYNNNDEKTWRIKKIIVYGSEIYTMRFTFATGTGKYGYYYYRCKIVDSLSHTTALFYGVVNSKTGRSGCVKKAEIIYWSYCLSAKKAGGIKEGFRYSEPVLFLNDSGISSTKQSISASLYGDIVFQYQKGKGMVPLTSKVKGEIKYTFTHGHQFYVWVIPVYVEVTVDVSGNVSLNFKYDDSFQGIAFDDITAGIEMKLSLSIGAGCKVASVGVSGSVGLLFVVEFLPENQIQKFEVSGNVSIYAKAFCFKGSIPLVQGSWVVIDRTQEGEPASWSLRGSETEEQKSEALLMSSIFLVENYELELEEALAEEAVMLVANGDIYKLYFIDRTQLNTNSEIDNEYDTYNCRKLALARWDSAGCTWSEPIILDDNGLNDLAFDLYESDGNVSVVYTQQSSKVDEQSAEDTYEYVSELVIKYAELTDILKSETANIVPVEVAAGDYYKYLAGFAMVDGMPTVVWAENSDNNMFGVSPYNYISGDSVENAESHVFETTANSVRMSRYDGTSWSVAEVVADGLSAITDMTVSDSGVIAYIVDGNGNLADAEDRALYLYDISSEKTELAATEQGKSVLNVDAESGGIILYCNTDGANSIEYLSLDGPEGELGLPEDTSMLSDEYRILYDSTGRPEAILYVQNKTWEELGESRDGAAVYGIFRDGETWGSPIEIETDLIACVESCYISSFDAAWADETRESIVISAEYVNGSGALLACFTDEYELSSCVSFGEHTVNYTDSTLTLTLTNNGARPSEVYALIDGVRIDVCESIMSGESVECTLDISDCGNVPVIELYEVGSDEALYSITDIDLNHSDLRPYVKQLLLGTQNKLLVAVRNYGNVAASGKLYVSIGNYTAETVKTAATAVTVDSVSPSNIAYFEIPLTDALAVDENTVATIYVEADGDMEKGECVENDLIYDTLKAYEKAVADDGSSYVPEVHNTALTFDPQAPLDVEIEYSCAATDAIVSVSLGTTALSEDSFDISSEGIVTLKQAYLSTLPAGKYNIILLFASGENVTVELKVIAYYTVKWVNDSGASLAESKEIAEGSMARFEGTPTKDSTVEHTYVFEGWDADGDGEVDGLSAITSDMTYTAVWRTEAREYTVTWRLYNDNGAIDIPETYAYGKAPSYVGTYIAPFGMVFSAWDKTLESVSEDVVYTAVYEKASKGTAKLITSDFTAAPGVGFTTTLSMTDIANMSSTEITVYYDKQVASLMSVSVYDNVTCKEQGDGYIVLSVEAQGTQMPLVDLTFTASAGLAEGSYELMTAWSTDFVENGIDEVVIFKTGDVNGDGEVNTRDVAMVRQYVVGKLELNSAQLYYANAYADTNADGSVKINTRDVAMLQQYVVGSIEIIG